MTRLNVDPAHPRLRLDEPRRGRCALCGDRFRKTVERPAAEGFLCPECRPEEIEGWIDFVRRNEDEEDRLVFLHGMAEVPIPGGVHPWGDPRSSDRLRDMGLAWTGAPVDGEDLRALAACGATVRLWRDTELEGRHGDGWLTDGEMMAANVTAWRLVDRAMRAAEPWSAIGEALMDPGRRVMPDGPTMLGMLGRRGHREMQETVRAQVRALEVFDAIWGPDHTRHVLAFAHAMLSAGHWFGTPWWPDLVDVVAEHQPGGSLDPLAAPDARGRRVVPDGTDVGVALRTAPEHLPRVVLDRFVELFPRRHEKTARARWAARRQATSGQG